MKSSHETVKKIVEIALLSALVVIIQVFFSAVRIGPVTLSFVLIPIVIAAVLVGPLGGTIVGFVAGVTTLIAVFTNPDPFNTMLVTVNPVITSVICILKQTAAGFISGELYKIFSKFSKSQILNLAVAGGICPIVNTGIFCIGMLLFYKDGLYGLFGTDSGNIFYIVFILLAGVNFIVEFITNVVLCPAIGKALIASKVMKAPKKV